MIPCIRTTLLYIIMVQCKKKKQMIRAFLKTRIFSCRGFLSGFSSLISNIIICSKKYFASILAENPMGM